MCESCSVMSDSLRLHRLYSPWNSPGQNAGVGSLSLLRGSSQPRDQTQVSRIAGGFFTSWATTTHCIWNCSLFSSSCSMLFFSYFWGHLSSDFLKSFVYVYWLIFKMFPIPIKMRTLGFYFIVLSFVHWCFKMASTNLWRRWWHPTPVLLPGESHGWRSLEGCSPWGREELDMTEWTSLSLFTFMHWRRKWQPTPGFLPGESQGRGSLVGCRLWGRTESDMTEVT